MAGYYRKFVKHFGLLSKPLTNLLSKGEQSVEDCSDYCSRPIAAYFPTAFHY
jgi:hypothetical protein